MTAIARLPGPVADLWDWQLEGSCRRESPDVFFHPEGERGPARRNRDSAAKAVCMDCPVLQACREHALQVREPYGVWGGLTEHEREASYATAAEHTRERVSLPSLRRETPSHGSITAIDGIDSIDSRSPDGPRRRARASAGLTGSRPVQPRPAAGHRTPARI